MMSEPMSQRFDSDQILQRVWQGDYPNTWRVFYGHETIVSNTSTYITNLVLIRSSLLTCLLVGFLASAKDASNNADLGLTILFLFVVLIGVAIFLTIRSIVKERRKNKKLRQQPNPTLVVMPDGVVEYRRQYFRSLAFADIAYMRLRVQEYSVWLDLSFYSGRRDSWSTSIPPQDMIAQCILDSYNTYRHSSDFRP